MVKERPGFKIESWKKIDEQIKTASLEIQRLQKIKEDSRLDTVVSKYLETHFVYDTIDNEKITDGRNKYSFGTISLDGKLEKIRFLDFYGRGRISVNGKKYSPHITNIDFKGEHLDTLDAYFLLKYDRHEKWIRGAEESFMDMYRMEKHYLKRLNNFLQRIPQEEWSLTEKPTEKKDEWKGQRGMYDEWIDSGWSIERWTSGVLRAKVGPLEIVAENGKWQGKEYNNFDIRIFAKTPNSEKTCVNHIAHPEMEYINKLADKLHKLKLTKPSHETSVPTYPIPKKEEDIALCAAGCF